MYKKTLLSLALATATLLSTTSNAASLQDTYPVEKTVTLESGKEVTLPFHVEGTTSAILSLSNNKFAEKLISNDDWEVVNLPCQEDTGISILYLQNVTDSPVGAYDETVLTYLVKKKDAPDLPLTCLSDTSDPLVVMDYIATAMFTMGAVNQPNVDAGLPSDYGMFNYFLELDNQDAVDAGIEIWGYPKIKSEVKHTLTEDTFSTSVKNIHSGKSVLELSYQRVGQLMPLMLVGDNILPQDDAPSPDSLSQVKGILTTAEGTYAQVAPFYGTFEVGKLSSKTSRALRKTEFSPVGVIEFTDLEGVAFELYEK